MFLMASMLLMMLWLMAVVSGNLLGGMVHVFLVMALLALTLRFILGERLF